MAHGGKRAGAGRPKGQVKEPTKVIRVPISRIEQVKNLIHTKPVSELIPLYSHKVAAGFPSPAEDDIETYLDLNEHLIQHPASTFMVRAQGESMLGAGIFSGDILIVDKSLEATHGKVVVAAVNGELTVKRLYRKGGVVKLQAENTNYPDIYIAEEIETVIWGVVTSVIHAL